LEFAASLLSSVIGVSDKVSFYIHEAQSSGITVLPPDVQYSYNDFAIEGEAIRFGLGAIRNVGAQVVEKIIAERKNGAFDSFYDFVSRMDSRMVNKRVMESLIKAGASVALLESTGFKCS
jgi:DNA polymerase-3 subunit alpha